jgi:hypothetical protein
MGWLSEPGVVETGVGFASLSELNPEASGSR